MVVAVYVGFDEPRTLGRYETGAAAALPIFHDFMKEALEGQPDVPFRIPSGIKLVRINHDTGKPATPTDTSVIWEALKPEAAKRPVEQKIIGDESEETPEDGETEAAPVVVYENTGDDEIQFGTEY